MSTTSDPAVALQYSSGGVCALLFKITTQSFIDRGADLTFVSAFASEHEYLYPPLSYLQPTGRRETISLTATGDTINVVEVRPRFAS